MPRVTASYFPVSSVQILPRVECNIWSGGDWLSSAEPDFVVFLSVGIALFNQEFLLTFQNQFTVLVMDRRPHGHDARRAVRLQLGNLQHRV